jgi:hypothetical protein
MHVYIMNFKENENNLKNKINSRRKKSLVSQKFLPDAGHHIARHLATSFRFRPSLLPSRTYRNTWLKTGIISELHDAS